MEWVEASGRSLGEAREAALDLLGVAEDDAEFVTLSEPKAGLFGRVRGEARVQARVRPTTPPPKRGQRKRPDRKRSNGNGASDDAPSGPAGEGKQGGRQNTKRSAQPKDEATSEGAGDSNGSGGPSSAGGRSRRGGGGGRNSGVGVGARDQNGTSRSAAGSSTVKRTGQQSGESEGIVEESLTIEQQGEAGSDFLSGLIRQFGLEAEVRWNQVDEETVEIAAVGDDLGMLVGPRGATLSAVQDLTRTFVQRQSENRTDRILVDVGGYREKRMAALRRFTEGLVDEVKASGSERALEPMNAADRKVVHDSVNDMEGVRTRSEGEDPSRYVVIEPIS